MKHKSMIALCVLLAAGLVSAGGVAIVDSRQAEDLPGQKFKKILVIGLAHDSALRDRLEIKFAGALKSRRVESIESRTLLPNLVKVKDPAAAIAELMQQEGIDGVITIRSGSYWKKSAAKWPGCWEGWVEPVPSLQAVLADSIPAPKKVKGDQIGVSVTFWAGDDMHRIWVGRTDTHPKDDLINGMRPFVQSIVDTMRGVKLL